MTQLLHRRVVWAAAVSAVLVVFVMLVLMPPAPTVTQPLQGSGPTARGAYHIHSDRSDGSGSLDEIAAAAARAGLQFIVVTDHGDGTRAPDAPQYRHGVLVIDAVELNTTNGHLVALGLPVAPYPLAGTAADVLADVRRLGGIGIAAHPDSPRVSLRWSAWDVEVDGLEWINADSGWRDESSGPLARAVFSYWFRAPGAIATLLDRPVDLLARWDTLGATRSVRVLAAADAHARLGFRQTTDPDVSSVHVPVPAYEAAFRAFSNHVILDRPLSGDGEADAAAVIAAIALGRAFTVIDALATPGGLHFTAESAGRTVARLGDALTLDGETTLSARISGPPGTTLRLLKNGVPVRETQAAELSLRAENGVYRVEAHAAGAPGSPPVPWLLSNPIYVGLPRAVIAVGDRGSPSLRAPARTAEASVENGAGDVSELVEAQPDKAPESAAEAPPIGWRFALAPGAAAGQFAAVQLPTMNGLAAFKQVRFTVKSASPIRAWVQLRGASETERWGRTFYSDETTRIVELPLDSFRSIGETSTAAPPLDQVRSLLFVVDTLNSRPGAAGRMTIAEVAFVR